MDIHSTLHDLLDGKYFDKETQMDIVGKIVAQMNPEGLYFAGHSENFGHVNSLLKPLGKTIYKPKR